MSQTKITRPDLDVPVEAWGTIKSATAKLTWLARVDAVVAAGIVERSFTHLAINIATNPKGVNSQTGLTWRSARTLADNTGLTKSTVKRLLEEAVAAGLLFVVRKGRPGRDGQSTIYRLAMPEAGNGPPVRRFQRKKRPTHETKNPRNGPSMVPETAHSSCRKRPTSGTHLLRDITPRVLTPLERGAHAHAAQSARVERGDVTESETTSDDAPRNPALTTSADAPVPEPLTPVPRPIGRPETVEAQQPKPSRDNPIGAAASGARAAFEDVRFAWPTDRTDEGAYAAYVSALAAAQDDTEVVLDAVWEVLEESGADLPWLSDALRRIEHDLRTR